MDICIYCRVSKNDGSQNVENQKIALQEWAKRLGGTIVAEYYDCASGADKERVGLKQMLQDAHHRKFTVLMIWSIDRLSRSGIASMVKYIEELRLCDVRVMSHQESWADSSSPLFDLVSSVFAWIAEFERQRIKDRILCGLARARAKHVKFGRPERRIDLKSAIKMKTEGQSLRAISRALKIPRATLARKLASQNHSE